MPVRELDGGIPPPQAWPGRVRAAVIQTISLARFALTIARGGAANACDARVWWRSEDDGLSQELALLQKEPRIKDARMARIPPQRRPHHPATERLAILELRVARGWPVSQTAEPFLVTPGTIASRTGRLDEKGPNALVQLREPANDFPDFPCAPIRGGSVTSSVE